MVAPHEASGVHIAPRRVPAKPCDYRDAARVSSRGCLSPRSSLLGDPESMIRHVQVPSSQKSEITAPEAISRCCASQLIRAAAQNPVPQMPPSSRGSLPCKRPARCSKMELQLVWGASPRSHNLAETAPVCGTGPKSGGHEAGSECVHETRKLTPEVSRAHAGQLIHDQPHRKLEEIEQSVEWGQEGMNYFGQVRADGL